MLTFRSRFLTRGEVWFDEEPDGTPVDWIYYRQRPNPVARGRWKNFYTLLIDLTKSPAQLLSEMDVKTVRKIEQAEAMDLTRWERCEEKDPKNIDEIERMWNESAVAWKSRPLDRAWVDKLSEAGALEVSSTRDTRGNVLTYHLGYVGKKRAQDLMVVSPYCPQPNIGLRNRINRANCLGHWKTLLTLKERGIRQYDFGGWYSGTTDPRLLGMNLFKKGFGGHVVREFEGEEIRTMKGWTVLSAARILKRSGMLEWIVNARADQNRKDKPVEPARYPERECRTS
jgi:hypothetical protein